MGEMTVPQIVQFLNSGGTLAGLLIILWAGKNRIWVWGYQLAAKEVECTKWQDLCLRLMNVSEATVKTVVKGTEP